MDKAVKAMEERAAARLAAAEDLQRLADRKGVSGLVREELLRGVCRMLDQQLEYLQGAEKMKRGTQVARTAAAQRSLY